MKWISLVTIACVMSVGLVACSVTPSKVNNTDAFAKNITYFRDSRTGLCFAAVATVKGVEASQSGMGLTCVPCEHIPKGLLE